MKITIEPEGDDQGEERVFEGVFEFVLVGGNVLQGIVRASFSHLHTGGLDSINQLIGRCETAKERLRDAKEKLDAGSN